MVVTTRERRAKPSLIMRVSEHIYNKIADIADANECNMRDAADMLFNDMIATIARQQGRIEELEKKVKELKKEVLYWKKKKAEPD